MGGAVREGPWVRLGQPHWMGCGSSPHATAVRMTDVLTGGTSADACLHWRSPPGAPWVLTGAGRAPVSCPPVRQSLPPIPQLPPEIGPSQLTPKGASHMLGPGWQGR